MQKIYLNRQFPFISTFCCILGLSNILRAEPMKLTANGTIPAWLVAGPFELEYLGFGMIAEKLLIDEKTVEPILGKTEVSDLTLSKTATWQYHAPDKTGFVDLNTAIGWAIPGLGTEKIWWGKAGLAACYIYSNTEQDVFLLTGSNSRLKVFLNGREIFKHWAERNAKADDDTIAVHLKKGKNLLILTVQNSHNNTLPDWFGGLDFSWGFYARLTDQSLSPIHDIEIQIPEAENRLDFEVTPTIFFKKNAHELLQRLEIAVTSSSALTEPATFNITIDKKNYSFNLAAIPAGISRHAVYIAEPERDVKVDCRLNSGAYKISKRVNLPKQKHYQIYLGLTSHLDIGYTNTQPVVIERQIKALDDVLEFGEKYPDFKWTIEATWCLEQFRQSRPAEQFLKLVNMVKAGRVAVSPLYSNPYTGWIDYAEMIRTFDLAKELNNEYGFRYNAAIINDLPGLSWIIPQMLNQAGANFLVCGLNDFYGQYSLQQNVPKVFLWEGPEKSKVITYLTNAYNEGMNYGLEKGTAGIMLGLWQNLKKLESAGYAYDLVYVNSAMSDNGGVPDAQFAAAREWNREYEFPKIVISNLAQFATDFTAKYSEVVPKVQGDWTSAWDILYQSEPELFIQHRAIQHKLLSAEKLTTLDWLLNPDVLPEEKELAEAYRATLNFAGHGSGLEYSYGSLEENQWAVVNRVGNMKLAELLAEEILERGAYRFGQPHFGIEANGMMVFNTLSWERDIPVTIQLPHLNQTVYQVVDLASGKIVPSRQENNEIVFIARKMPVLGYRKYEFVTGKPESKSTDLVSTTNSIENQHYSLKYDPSTGQIQSITDKKTGQIIADEKFNQLLCERNIGKETALMKAKTAEIVVRDERPVRLVLEIRRPGFLLDEVQYILWNELDRIDIDFSVDVSRLAQTDVIEEYGIAFPFIIDKPTIMIENLGGFLNPEKDCMPGKSQSNYSIRRTVALSDRKTTVTWAALDSRVIKINKNDTDVQPALYSNFINNFPLSWNRNQITEGHLKTRFAITARSGQFDPGFTARFGWEVATPAVVMRAPLKRYEPQNGFLTIDRPEVLLISMRSNYQKDELILNLLNVDPQNAVTARVASELFKDKSAFRANVLGQCLQPVQTQGGTISVTIGPNELLPIILTNEK